MASTLLNPIFLFTVIYMTYQHHFVPLISLKHFFYLYLRILHSCFSPPMSLFFTASSTSINLSMLIYPKGSILGLPSISRLSLSLKGSPVLTALNTTYTLMTPNTFVSPHLSLNVEYMPTHHLHLDVSKTSQA